jgi:anti-sigma regulatory factor (Ser/Thr protein kinase)
VAGLSQELSPAADEPPAAGCARLAAEYVWSKSEFGPQETWDPAVAAIVGTLLETTAPMAYFHGAGYAMVYNDRFADLLGARHPRAWSQQAALVLPEIWSRPGYAKAIDNVFAGGPSFHDDGSMLNLKADPQTRSEWTYLARSYSPVRDKNDSVVGVLVVVVEIAPVLVLVGGAEPGDQGGAKWTGTDPWGQTVARHPLIWSGFRASSRPPEAPVSEPDQRFVAIEGQHQVLPINGPAIAGSIGYRGMRRHLPDVQMLTLAARERNPASEITPGSEFYDVFGMPDGKIALTIGEVKNAGTAAATVMATVKEGLRGATLTHSEPTAVFAALDELVDHRDASWPVAQNQDRDSAGAGPGGFDGELFVTALLGIFDPATGGLALASAGHIRPALVHRQSSHAEASSGRLAEYPQIKPGPPLGVAGTRPVTQTVLREGDALVGVTKGLLERYTRDLSQGQSRLLAALSAMSATAARAISQHVVDALIGDRGLDHDCAILVVVRDSRDHLMNSVLVPPHNSAVGGARRWARAQLECWGVNQEDTATAVMCVSELVTNVVQHAGTTARVTLELADRLLVIVEDTGTWSTPHTPPQDDTAAQGRGLSLVGAVSEAMGHARGIDGSTVWFEMTLDRSNT